MAYRMYGTFIASLSVVVLVLAASETFADPGVARAGGFAPPGVARGGGFAPPRPAFPRSVGRSLHHQLHRGHLGIVGGWPTAGGDFYGPLNDEPMLAAPPPKTSDDIRYTCVYDIPWDYVHRCPQFVSPRE
jgi:hypothetical protein